jgi:DNA-binding XRE family transcriptional regulator
VTDVSFHKRRLAEKLKDAEFKEEYERTGREIAQVDAIMRQLDQMRIEVGYTKAQLARHIGKEPASVRRLFSAGSPNPELKTIAAIADAVGADLALKPRRRTRTAKRGATA